MQQDPKMVTPSAMDLNNTTRDQAKELHGEQVGHSVPVIMTPSVFNFMDLPSELRIQIYNQLLLSDDVIEIPLTLLQSQSLAKLPHTTILRTCKKIDEEASPILYSKNTFEIYLGSDSKLLADLFYKFRWSSISSITSLKVRSSSPITHPLSRAGSTFSPHFMCSGKDIVAHFTEFAHLTESDLKYWPGPERSMALHIATWISHSITRAELTAMERDLEMEMEEEGDNEGGVDED